MPVDVAFVALVGVDPHLGVERIGTRWKGERPVRLAGADRVVTAWIVVHASSVLSRDATPSNQGISISFALMWATSALIARRAFDLVE